MDWVNDRWKALNSFAAVAVIDEYAYQGARFYPAGFPKRHPLHLGLPRDSPVQHPLHLGQKRHVRAAVQRLPPSNSRAAVSSVSMCSRSTCMPCQEKATPALQYQ